VRVLATAVALTAVALLVMVGLGRFGPSDQSVGPTTTARPAGRSTSPSPTPTWVTVTLTEQDLTRAAREYTPLTVSGITVTDPLIRLDPGRLTLTATGRAFIVSGPIVVVATPVVANGTAGANIETATFAGLGLPESTKRDIADTFSRTLAANIPAGVRVTAVTVRAGALVVEAAPS
jgi:DUF2993 family protein